MQEEITKARRRFIAMATTYFLGVFNDNFFKQAILLLAVSAGLSGLQGRATELFSLPFILFSAWGGWLADRFCKKNVVIGVKFLELAAMLIGAYGLFTMNWNCILAMIFLMGLQSTLFGPALNGSIPELYPPEYVTTANSVLKLVTTIAILLGMALAGSALDLNLMQTSPPFGIRVVTAVVISVALAGVAASFGVYSRPASGGKPPFPWSGPLHSARQLILMRQDPLLLVSVFCDSYFYFISLLAVLVINTLGITQLGLTKATTSIMSVSLMFGVCGGAFAASKLTSSKRWVHVLVPGATGMGICMFATGLLVQLTPNPHQFALLTLLCCTGFFGGLFLIPVTSFIQIRPAADSKGRIIAAANFLAFSGMWCSGRIFTLLDSTLKPSQTMMVLGVTSIAAGIILWPVLHKTIHTQQINKDS